MSVVSSTEYRSPVEGSKARDRNSSPVPTAPTGVEKPVAVSMVCLPLIYLALIAGTAYGVFWHATEHITIFERSVGILKLVIYLTPIFAGAVLIFFMLKPVLRAKAPEATPVKLTGVRTSKLVNSS